MQPYRQVRSIKMTFSVSLPVQSSDCKRPTTTNKERLLYELRKYTSDSTHRYVLHVQLRVVMLNSMRNQLTLGQAEASMAFFLLRLHLAVFARVTWRRKKSSPVLRGGAWNPSLIRGLTGPQTNFWRYLRLAKDAGRARRNCMGECSLEPRLSVPDLIRNGEPGFEA